MGAQEARAMIEDPHEVIRRLNESIQQQIRDNAALLQIVAKQRRQIAYRNSKISKLKAQRNAMAQHVRSAYATATAYVAAELPKHLEPILVELRRLQDAELLREIGDVDPKDTN
jgi:hypothetical protein